MNYIIHEKPCLLMETAELLYALVNHIPAEELTRDHPYCIPVSEITKIQETICRDLDLKDEELQFYFKGVPIDGREERLSCLACTLIYSHPPIADHEIDDALKTLHAVWFNHKRPFTVAGITGFALTLIDSPKYTNLSQEIGKLPVPQQYQAQLIEVFSGFGWHIDRLGALLRPLAERLKPLLAPWVEGAAPLRSEWEKLWSTPRSKEFMQNRINFMNDNVQEVQLTLRYFSPQNGAGSFSDETGTLRLHMGLATPLEQEAPVKRAAIEAWELTALRCLCRKECTDIFRAVRKTPKCIQDLSQELCLNPGTVFRNVNSLYNSGLLSLEIINGRNYYLASMHMLDKLTAHLLQHLKDE